MLIHVSFPDIMNTVLIHKVSFDVVEPGYRLEWRHHKIFEILHCWEGEVIEWVDEQELIFRTGDWLFLNSGVRHRTLNHSGKPFSFFAIHFDIDDPGIRKLLKSFKANRSYLSREAAESSALPQLIKQIESMVYTSLVDVRHTVRRDQEILLTDLQKLPFQAYALLIITEIMKLQQAMSLQGAGDSGQASGIELDLANRIANLLEERLCETAPVQSIAKLLMVSRSQCTRVFTKVYGISPRQYLSELKLRRSKEMLLHTEFSIEEIATQLGFSSAAHFSKQFRRWAGVPPSQFRPKHTGKSASFIPVDLNQATKV